MKRVLLLTFALIAGTVLAFALEGTAKACPSKSSSVTRACSASRQPIFPLFNRSKTVTKTTATSNAAAVAVPAVESQSSLDATITSQELAARSAVQSQEDAFAALARERTAYMAVPRTTIDYVPVPIAVPRMAYAAVAPPVITSESTTVTRGRFREPRPVSSTSTSVTRTRSRASN